MARRFDLSYCEPTGQVWLTDYDHETEEPIGYLNDGPPDELPAELEPAWGELADTIRDGQRYAEACEATANEAFYRGQDLQRMRWKRSKYRPTLDH